MKNKILITLATGKTGFETARQLLTEGLPVKILVRDRSPRALELERMGAEMVIGHFDNEVQLRRAMHDVAKVYYCYPFKPGLVEDLKLFITIAQDTNVESIVFMGQWLAQLENQTSHQTLAIQEAYKLLETSGLNVVYFIPGYFVENTITVYLEFAVQLGLFTNTFGDGKNPVVSNEDMAASLVALLKNPVPYYGKRLRPTGPKAVSARDIAITISKITRKRVYTLSIPQWMFVKAASMVKREYNFTDFTLSQAVLYNHQFKAHDFEAGGVTDVVKELTGREPEDLETIIRRLISESTFGMPSPTGWWKAFKKFMVIPLQKGISSQVLSSLNRQA